MSNRRAADLGDLSSSVVDRCACSVYTPWGYSQSVGVRTAYCSGRDRETDAARVPRARETCARESRGDWTRQKRRSTTETPTAYGSDHPFFKVSREKNKRVRVQEDPRSRRIPRGIRRLCMLSMISAELFNILFRSSRKQFPLVFFVVLSSPLQWVFVV